MAGSGPPLSLNLPVDAAGLAHARRALAAWLAAAGVSRDDVDDILIAGNEACMNAVEHSGAPADTTIALEAGLANSVVSLSVRDRGRWREPVPTQDRGHGIGLMRELMDDVELDRGDDGTHVGLRKAVSFGSSQRAEPAPAHVTTSDVGGTRVALLQGELDLAEVERVGRELDGATDGREPLVVDLSAVTYLDSAGVHLLFQLARRRRLEGGGTRIVAPGGSVRRVLELTGLATVLGLDDRVDGALRSLEEQGG